MKENMKRLIIILLLTASCLGILAVNVPASDEFDGGAMPYEEASGEVLPAAEEEFLLSEEIPVEEEMGGIEEAAADGETSVIEDMPSEEEDSPQMDGTPAPESTPEPESTAEPDSTPEPESTAEPESTSEPENTPEPIPELSAPALRKITLTAAGVKITWRTVAGADQYRIMRKTKTGWKKLDVVGGTSYTDTTVKSGSTYRYTVRALSGDAESGYDETGLSITYIAAPTLKKITNTTAGVKLTWKKSKGAEAYWILRKTSGGKWKKVGVATGTSYVDASAKAGVNYTYTVRCRSADGQSYTSSYDSTGLSILRLSSPVLSSAYASGGRVTLNWKKVKAAEGYHIYRKTGTKWKKIGSVEGGGILTYTDCNSRDGAKYTVRAYGSGAVSGYDTAGLTPKEANTAARILSNTAVAQETDQIVLVVDHNLTLWQRAANGRWKKSMDVYCGYGSRGLRLADQRSEGDKTTPIGAFPLILAFGTGENPGTDMTYRQITGTSYWSAEDDETYNTWVESAEPLEGEHLMDYYQYKYAVAIGFNLNPTVYGRGSAIFIHCKATNYWSTGGCVSLTEENMLKLMCTLKDGAYIVIVPNVEALSSY